MHYFHALQHLMSHSVLVAGVAQHPYWTYVSVFLLLFVQGEALLFAAAFFSFQGVLDVRIVVPLIFVGELVMATGCYGVGVLAHRRWPRIDAGIRRFIQPFEKHLRENTVRTITLAKFTTGGICQSLFIRAGALGMPRKHFYGACVQAIIVWIFVVGSVALAASEGLVWVGRYLRYAEIAFGVGILLFLLLEWWASRKITKRL